MFAPLSYIVGKLCKGNGHEVAPTYHQYQKLLLVLTYDICLLIQVNYHVHQFHVDKQQHHSL